MQNNDLQIFTIGHGSRKIEEFINLLKRHKVQTLVDVRTFPYSRFHPQYRKSNLIDALKSADIQYIFSGSSLGGRPSDKSLYFDGVVSFDAIKETDYFKNGITNLIQLVEDGQRIVLMCSESDENQCHRKHLLSGEFVKNAVDVFHINKFGDLKKELSDIVPNLFS